MVNTRKKKNRNKGTILYSALFLRFLENQTDHHKTKTRKKNENQMPQNYRGETRRRTVFQADGGVLGVEEIEDALVANLALGYQSDEAAYVGIGGRFSSHWEPENAGK